MSTQNRINDSPQESTPNMNHFYRFFCWCSGAQLNILEKYPGDWDRYFGNGIIIFLTGVFAFSSSSYALTTVFKDFDPATNTNTVNYWLIIPVATIWGIFIFFLDRFFISSMTLQSENKWHQFFTALPRLILAAFLGIIISRPLEYRFFRDDIYNELGDVKNEQLISLKKKYDAQEKRILFEDSLRRLNTEIGLKIKAEQNTIDKFKNNKESFNKDIAAALDSMNYETIGSGKSRIKGEGPNFKRWEAEHSRLLTTYENIYRPQWDEQIRIAQDSINSYNRKPDKEKLDIESDTKEKLIKLKEEREKAKKFKEQNLSFSLLSMEKGLNNLLLPKISTEPKTLTKETETSSNVKGIVYFFSLLFILIEMAPILVKLFSKRGKYEDALESQELELGINIRKNRFIARETYKINKGLIQKMGRSQRDIIKQNISNWEAEEKQRARRNRGRVTNEEENES